jgi:hypothetical protein
MDRTKRSTKRPLTPSIAMGLSLAIVVETLVVHLMLHEKHPAIAWTLTATSALTIVWLVGRARATAKASAR